MLPLGEAGHHHLLDVGHHRVERLDVGRRVFGELRPHVAWRNDGADRSLLDAADIVGDPIDEVVAVGAELVGGHATERRGAACARQSDSVVMAMFF